MSALVANGVWYVKGKVGTTYLRRIIQQHTILCFGKVLIQIQVTSTTPIKITGQSITMQLHLIQNSECFIFYLEEVGVVTISFYLISIQSIPGCMLHSEVFCHSVTFTTYEIVLLLFYELLELLQECRKFPMKLFYNYELFLLHNELFHLYV